ncbi:uncharacterized protein N7482_006944 [Penicillium canariense]|uniref:Uncharacterized protein n=1 Tax=Penicillium canariense TaxID=189055 RepID=A0A9W9I0P5_9EURO|nr:uncharacterized protein N7482_006944 [Penicillium canariense]KAJ5159940.1 hypothetical protein N7482_006944 [Penicillium canariense]
MWKKAPENSRNTATVSSTAALHAGKNSLPKVKPDCRSRRTTKRNLIASFTPQDVGFARFLEEHSSPTHQRVTAGGRIVPMGRPARLSRIVDETPENSMVGHTPALATASATDKFQQDEPSRNMTKPGMGTAASAPPVLVSSLNVDAIPFTPGHETPTINAARMKLIDYRNNAAGNTSTIDAINAAFTEPSEQDRWTLIWPPLPEVRTTEDEDQTWVQFRMQLAAQFIVSPVHVSYTTLSRMVRGNPALHFQPRQPIPVVFVDAQLKDPENFGPQGQYWTLITNAFRVTNEGRFPLHNYYRANLDALVWLVQDPQDEYEAFILLHATEWLKYHRRLFDHLIASVDHRRACMAGPDPNIRAERVYYVDQRAYVKDVIGRLEEVLKVAHRCRAGRFWRGLISLALEGEVYEDSERSAVRCDISDNIIQEEDQNDIIAPVDSEGMHPDDDNIAKGGDQIDESAQEGLKGEDPGDAISVDCEDVESEDVYSGNHETQGDNQHVAITQGSVAIVQRDSENIHPDYDGPMGILSMAEDLADRLIDDASVYSSEMNDGRARIHIVPRFIGHEVRPLFASITFEERLQDWHDGTSQTHAVSIPVINTWFPQSHPTENQSVQTTAEDGVNSGANASRRDEGARSENEVSSQSVDVNIRPNKGKQVARGDPTESLEPMLRSLNTPNPVEQLRDLSVVSHANVDSGKPAGFPKKLTIMVIGPATTWNEMTLKHAYADEENVSKVKAVLVRLRG